MTLSPQAEKKLDRIAEIQEEMEKLEGELESLLVGGPKPLTIRDKEGENKYEFEEFKPNGGKGRPASSRTCSRCSKKGHTYRTCTEEPKPNKDRYSGYDETRDTRIKELLKKGMSVVDIAKEVGCSAQTIYNRKKILKFSGISMPDAAPAEEVAHEHAALNENEFEDVQDEKMKGISADRIAEDMRLPIEEVRRAFRTPDYKGYIVLRKMHD